MKIVGQRTTMRGDEMTLKEAKNKCKELGCRLTCTDYEDYRVVPLSDPREEVAYYTTDLEDAVSTAMKMVRRVQ